MAESRPATGGPATSIRLGERHYDIGDRALVMGILNRTTDSFYDGGAHFRLGALVRRAEVLLGDGADLLEVGARAAGVGAREVSEGEETHLVASSVAQLRRRFDLPIAVDTQRASVAEAAFREGAVMGNDISGFSDPGYLSTAAAAGATVVATHIRLPPGVADPHPVYQDVLGDVESALVELAARAAEAGIAEDRIVVDPGLDLGKTWRQSLRLLGAIERLAALGYPVLLAASNKIFLGRALGLGTEARGLATIAAGCYGIVLGARILRVHDALGARQAADLFTELQANARQ